MPLANDWNQLKKETLLSGGTYVKDSRGMRIYLGNLIFQAASRAGNHCFSVFIIRDASVASVDDQNLFKTDSKRTQNRHKINTECIQNKL